MWPEQLDYSRGECLAILRSLELKAFSGMVDALRASGELIGERASLLADLARLLHISPLRQKTEIRRAVNSELLATLAAKLCSGGENGDSWRREARRIIPILPRAPPITGYSQVAERARHDLNSLNAELAVKPHETRTVRAPSPLIRPQSPPVPPSPLHTADQSDLLLTNGQLSPEKLKSEVKSELDEEDGEDAVGKFVLLPSGMAVRLKEERRRGSSPAAGSGSGRRRRGAGDTISGKRKRSVSSRSIEVFPDGVPGRGGTAAADITASGSRRSVGAPCSPPRKLASMPAPSVPMPDGNMVSPVHQAGHGYARPLPRTPPRPSASTLIACAAQSPAKTQTPLLLPGVDRSSSPIPLPLSLGTTPSQLGPGRRPTVGGPVSPNGTSAASRGRGRTPRVRGMRAGFGSGQRLSRGGAVGLGKAGHGTATLGAFESSSAKPSPPSAPLHQTPPPSTSQPPQVQVSSSVTSVASSYALTGPPPPRGSSVRPVAPRMVQLKETVTGTFGPPHQYQQQQQQQHFLMAAETSPAAAIYTQYSGPTFRQQPASYAPDVQYSAAVLTTFGSPSAGQAMSTTANQPQQQQQQYQLPGLDTSQPQQQQFVAQHILQQQQQQISAQNLQQLNNSQGLKVISQPGGTAKIVPKSSTVYMVPSGGNPPRLIATGHQRVLSLNSGGQRFTLASSQPGNQTIRLPQPGSLAATAGSGATGVIRTIRTVSAGSGGGSGPLAGKSSVIVVQKSGPTLLPGRLAAATGRPGAVALYRPTRAMLAAAASSNGSQRFMLETGSGGSSGSSSVVRLAHQTRPTLRPPPPAGLTGGNVILLDLSQTASAHDHSTGLGGGSGSSEVASNFIAVSSATAGVVDTAASNTASLQRIGVSAGGIVISTTQHTLGKKVLLASNSFAEQQHNPQQQHHHQNSSNLLNLEGNNKEQGIWLQLPEPEEVCEESEATSLMPGQIRTLSATSGRFVTLPQRGQALTAAVQQQQIAPLENNGDLSEECLVGETTDSTRPSSHRTDAALPSQGLDASDSAQSGRQNS